MLSAIVWPDQNIESVIKLENSSFAIACDVLDRKAVRPSTDEIVYRYRIPVYTFIGVISAERRTKTSRDQWERAALNGTTSLSSNANVPRKLLTILAYMVGRVPTELTS
jgi:hypothetical protein